MTFQKADGMNYAPKGKVNLVVKPGEFVFAAAHLDHGHIFGMCNGLLEAGAQLKWVYDPDPAKVADFLKRFPMATPAQSEDQILCDPEVKLVAAAAVTSERCAFGCRVMDAGKDYFTDKAPLTTLEQLETAKSTGTGHSSGFTTMPQFTSTVGAGKTTTLPSLSE